MTSHIKRKLRQLVCSVQGCLNPSLFALGRFFNCKHRLSTNNQVHTHTSKKASQASKRASKRAIEQTCTQTHATTSMSSTTGMTTAATAVELTTQTEILTYTQTNKQTHSHATTRTLAFQFLLNLHKYHHPRSSGSCFRRPRRASDAVPWQLKAEKLSLKHP